MPALLSVEELSVSLRRHGGRGIGLARNPARGRCLGVIGESGAGKTQAFLAMMGLLPRTGAHCRPRAPRRRTICSDPPQLQLRGRGVAMIFQDPMTSLTPHLRIGDQIAEPLVTHRD